MSNIYLILTLVFMQVACNKVANRFGFGSSEQKNGPEDEAAPHPFEVTEQEQVGGLTSSASEQSSNEVNPGMQQATNSQQMELNQGEGSKEQEAPSGSQVANEAKLTCNAESPALVIFDRESKSLFFCDRGVWSPVLTNQESQLRPQEQGQVPAGAGAAGMHRQFVIRPSTDTFLCTQSEKFPKSYICSKKDRLLRKKGYKPGAETALTEGP